MTVSTRFIEVDAAHNTWMCTRCDHIAVFETDGPIENGWVVCPACARDIQGVNVDAVE